MPIYEYRCTRCEKEFEELVFGSSPEVSCPKCKNTEVERLLSTFSYKRDGSMPGSNSSSSCGTCSSTNCSSCNH